VSELSQASADTARIGAEREQHRAEEDRAGEEWIGGQYERQCDEADRQGHRRSGELDGDVAAAAAAGGPPVPAWVVVVVRACRRAFFVRDVVLMAVRSFASAPKPAPMRKLRAGGTNPALWTRW
jgi:hypothetical protein